MHRLLSGMGRKRTLAWLMNERPLTGVGQKLENDRDGRRAAVHNSGVSPVKLKQNQRLFSACSRCLVTENSGFSPNQAVEHCVDIAGVASSILATPTIFSPENSDFDDPDRCRKAHAFACFKHDFAGGLVKFWANSEPRDYPYILLNNNNSWNLFTKNRARTHIEVGQGTCPESAEPDFASSLRLRVRRSPARVKL